MKFAVRLTVPEVAVIVTVCVPLGVPLGFATVDVPLHPAIIASAASTMHNESDFL